MECCLGENMKKCKVISINKIGKRKTYNMTMESDQHNYSLYDSSDDDSFVISQNSCCYGYLSYQTAYLKANYPDEFACSFLNTFTRRAISKSPNMWDNVAMMEKDAQRTLGVKFLPRTLKDCSLNYKIVRKKDPSKGIQQTEIIPSVCCKGLGLNKAQEIVSHAPYENLEDLVSKTNSSIVTKEAISSLIDAGYFKGRTGQNQKDEIIAKFEKIRDGLKASIAKGIDSSIDVFA
jgi:DNA polymerase III alpha subunit